MPRYVASWLLVSQEATDGLPQRLKVGAAPEEGGTKHRDTSHYLIAPGLSSAFSRSPSALTYPPDGRHQVGAQAGLGDELIRAGCPLSACSCCPPAGSER